MNFLQGVQRLASECGVSGSISTVVGQTGEAGRLVNWYNTAWVDIQAAHQDWQWLRSSASFVTVDGQATYTPTECGVTDLGKWDRHSFRCYPTDVGVRGEVFLSYRDYESWRNSYQFNAFRLVTARPIEITVTPNTSLGLGPSPNATGYTIVGDYFKSPTEMALDADTPILPAKHHMAIVYLAMMSYGAFEAAPEVFQRGQSEYAKWLRRMEGDRLPEMISGGCLA